MKHTILALLLVVTGSAHAGATGGFTAADAGIVTPDVATGMRGFYNFTSNTSGAMVVCIQDDSFNRGRCDEWKLITSCVPPGKTYVGFRVVSGSYGTRQLELYWK